MCRDQAETLLCILDHCEQDPKKIAFQIEKIFTDNVEGIVFCTIHKAKGLEAKNIFILNPELLPHPMAKRDWQIEQEMNLKYVAITRSLDTLTWVTA